MTFVISESVMPCINLTYCMYTSDYPTIHVHYRNDPHVLQNSMRKLITNSSPDPNRYRRRCPDTSARIQKFIHYMAIAAICDS